MLQLTSFSPLTCAPNNPSVVEGSLDIRLLSGNGISDAPSTLEIPMHASCVHENRSHDSRISTARSLAQRFLIIFPCSSERKFRASTDLGTAAHAEISQKMIRSTPASLQALRLRQIFAFCCGNSIVGWRRGCNLVVFASG
jgi:hypothetical protein